MRILSSVYRLRSRPSSTPDVTAPGAAGLLLGLVVSVLMIAPAPVHAASADAATAVRPGVLTSVDAASTAHYWPWRQWRRARVTPRFEYRQLIGAHAHRRSRSRSFEIRTRYRYITRSASRFRARFDVVVEGIDVYRRGRYIGTVDRLPRSLQRVRARVRRGRAPDLDRRLVLVGRPGRGFEVLALDSRRRTPRARVRAVGVVRLREGRVQSVRRSRLLHGRRYTSLVRVPLLPSHLGQERRYDRWSSPGVIGFSGLYGSRGDYDAWRFNGRGGAVGYDRSDRRRTWSEPHGKQRRARRSTERNEMPRLRRDRSTSAERGRSGERSSERDGDVSRSVRLRSTDEEPRFERRAGVRRLENGGASADSARDRDRDASADDGRSSRR
jgi:hypothetical protein